MKFVVDAHLPYELKQWINSQGADAVHTRDLPQKNLTGDLDIIGFSVEEKRVVITKDVDFYDYYVLKG